MGGLLPLNPLDLLELADRLQWPCEDDECIQVLGAMDDAWRSLKDTGGE